MSMTIVISVELRADILMANCMKIGQCCVGKRYHLVVDMECWPNKCDTYQNTQKCMIIYYIQVQTNPKVFTIDLD